MTTLTVTYDKSKTKQVAGAYIKQLVDVIVEQPFDKTKLKNLCGGLSYSALFMMPDYVLQDKGVYSIDKICYNTNAFFKVDLRNLLRNLGFIALDQDPISNLWKVIDAPLYYECMQMIADLPKEVYVCLVLGYYGLSGRTALFEELQKLIKLPYTYSDIAKFVGVGIG